MDATMMRSTSSEDAATPGSFSVSARHSPLPAWSRVGDGVAYCYVWIAIWADRRRGLSRCKGGYRRYVEDSRASEFEGRACAWGHGMETTARVGAERLRGRTRQRLPKPRARGGTERKPLRGSGHTSITEVGGRQHRGWVMGRWLLRTRAAPKVVG